MNKTITLQTGNSDDKLTQVEWSELVNDLGRVIQQLNDLGLLEIHFGGSSPSYAPWQNYCWVFEMKTDIISILSSIRQEVSVIRERHNQCSVAWTKGETEFI